MATESENQKGFIADHTDNEIEREETTVDDPQEGACGCPQINSESKGGGKESGHVSKTAGVDAKLPNDTDFDKLGTRVKEAEESESQRKSRDNFVRNPELKPESNIDIKHKDSATHDDHSSNENEDKSDEPVGIMSEEEKEARRNEALELKKKGNNLFKSGEFEDAINSYSEGLQLCPKDYVKDISVLFANRAACHVKMGEQTQAIADCSSALELDEYYIKARLRRAQAYEASEKLDEALEDYKKVIQLDRGNQVAGEAIMNLHKKSDNQNKNS